MRVLVLGGTSDGAALAAALDGAGVRFVSSLAGRLATPRMPVGAVRVGGFGGVGGLAAFIAEVGITHVIDATHPFAAQMRMNARAACAELGVPLLRLARPGWASHPHAASWQWVADLDEAREAAERAGERPFLTTGRQTLHAFEPWRDRAVLVRVIERLADAPPRWTVLYDRGPYTMEGELDLLRDHRVDVLLTKDSGGASTSAKLDACAQLGVPVVVLKRPDEGDTPAVASVAEALAWLRAEAP